jgi:hypothetical protein
MNGFTPRKPHVRTHFPLYSSERLCTEKQLAAMRGGLTAEENRWKLIRGRKG